ncbi:MAG: hypothetical protein HUJ77_12740 [Clostridium sp.]|uniref:hypothetical protein n=1 Tax=Clostridium sp. TaxID=1506 RepID=UPI0025B9BB8C|nr:hypothetical protein [Clostridium sp.]MCF0149250.1 hypothetical protein [Clostridium sp.]
MNCKRKRKYILVSLIILITSISYGCKSEVQEKESIKLNNGSVAIDNNGNYKTYNLNNGLYEEIEADYIITSYDSKSNNYIFNEEGEFKVHYSGEEKLIDEDNEIFSPKLSPEGNYLSYFLKDIYLNLKVQDLKKDKFIAINSSVSISGELIDWYNSESLVYYGIDDSKNNGIFIYNIDKNEEKLIYKLDSGYVEYLEVLNDGVVFLQQKEGKKKTLKFIDGNGELKDSIENIIDISDVEHTDGSIYIIGKVENNNYSLYEYNDEKVKRLVYDFPKIINLDKGLSKDSNGNILFIGGDEPNVEKVYICEDGAISELSDIEGKYYFINYN